jgi:hypothetical protein
VPNNLPGPPRRRSTVHARRDAVVFSRVRNLERFQAQCAAIMADKPEDDISEQDYDEG